MQGTSTQGLQVRAGIHTGECELVEDGLAGIALHIAARVAATAGPGEVLVRVAASPVNPSDLMFLEGRYAFKKELPAIPGIEGSGRVVAVGSGLLARRLANRRVACATKPMGGGAWAEYAIARAEQCLALPDRIDDEHGAMSLVNPLAAVGLMERIAALRSRSFVSTAAGSALGQMLRRIARTRQFEVINVVRRADQAERLRREGVDHALVSEDGDFDARLKDLSPEHHQALWGSQSFYRVFSTVNGGRARETDLFEGISR